MTKIRKHSSKRITLRKKYTCEKKVRDHKKKLKKEIRNMKKGGILKKPISKGVGIPNLYPFKNEMLDQLERKEKLDEDYRLHLQALKKAQKTLPQGTMESYAQTVQA